MKALATLSFGLFLALNAYPAQNADFYSIQPPPASGSQEHLNDFLILHHVQDYRTSEQCKEAEDQRHLSVKNNFGPSVGILNKKEVRNAQLLAARVMIKTTLAVAYFKNKFKRPRPYLTDPTLLPCIKKPIDYAYPSGHTAIGYALALALAKVYPNKKEALLLQGHKLGEYRVLGGVHHPSDLLAGRELAKQVVRGMKIRTHKTTGEITFD